jgi:hypothetical protein
VTAGAIRLVVSDVDGTLVDKQKQLTPGTIAAVARLRDAGLPFTIISARPRSGMMPILDALKLDCDVAAFNGGILFRRDGSESVHHLVDAEVARGAMAAASGLAVDIWVFADDRWYASTGQGPHVNSERRASNQEPVVRTDMTDLLHRADKITFVSDEPAVLHDLKARIDAAFAGKATVIQSQAYYLDITALAANKGNGVAALAAIWDVPLSAVAAIGDQANDIAMLERAGLAIAMGNAPDAVKAVAGHVTRANDADGVAHAIDTIILGKAFS